MALTPGIKLEDWASVRRAIDKLKTNTNTCFWCTPTECIYDIALFGLSYTTCEPHKKMESGLQRLLMSLARGAYKKYRPDKI